MVALEYHKLDLTFILRKFSSAVKKLVKSEKPHADKLKKMKVFLDDQMYKKA